MLKKKIKYTDFNDVEREETFYFNLSKAELIELYAEENGGFDEYIKSIVESGNNKEILAAFKKIIRMAYGEKSLDGKYLKKSEELADNFCSTNAYSELVMELMSDEKAAANFINSVIPADVKNQIDSNDNKSFIPASVKNS